MTFRQPIIRPASKPNRDLFDYGWILAFIAAGFLALAMVSVVFAPSPNDSLIEEQEKTRELLCLVLEVQEYEMGPKLREDCNR